MRKDALAVAMLGDDVAELDCVDLARARRRHPTRSCRPPALELSVNGSPWVGPLGDDVGNDAAVVLGIGIERTARRHAQDRCGASTRRG